MKTNVVLNIVAWLLIPLAFAGYIDLAYVHALERRALPFLGAHELSWWMAFVVGLALGCVCIVAAHPRSSVARITWTLAYIVVMGVVFVGAQWMIACGHGDCL
jgi:FtsH-binding integral membrane protein